MREPTPIAVAFAWHRQALEDMALGLEVTATEEPQCGWFRRRMAKGGVQVPARIWLFQEIDADTGELLSDELMQCEVNGEYRDPHDEWTWLFGQPISEAEFSYLTERNRWAERYAPDEPAANPRQPVDWLKVPTPRFT